MTDLNLQDMRAFHEENGCAITVAVQHCKSKQDDGGLLLDENGVVMEQGEAGLYTDLTGCEVNCGVYIVEPWIFEEIEDDCEALSFRDLLNYFISKNIKVMAYREQFYFQEVCGAAELYKVNMDMLSGAINQGVFFDDLKELLRINYSDTSSIMPDIIKHATAQMSLFSELKGKVVVGPDVQVAANVRIDDCILLRGASVSMDVKNSIVGRDFIISMEHKDGWKVKNALVAENSVVKKEDHLPF